MFAPQSEAAERLSVRLAAVLFAALAMVPIVARPAQAAPPTIAASDEEVLFGIGDTTSKLTTITWDVGDEEEAEITLSKNGGPSSTWSNLPAGSKVFEVVPESATYLFCIQQDRDVFGCVTVKSTILTITPGEEKPQSDPKIDLGFISKISSDPSGYSAKISYTTDSPTIPVVLVSQKKPLAFPVLSADQPKVFETQDVEGVSFNLVDGPQTSHTNKLINLDPGTTYHYVISAENKVTGYWQTESGTFKTLQRNVSVTYSQIQVLDDSDDLSAGDFAFTFFINGGGPSGWPKTIFSSAGTGSFKVVNLTGTVTNAPPTLNLKLVGYDDDELEAPFSLATCGANAADFAKNEGQNDCGEWTTAKDSFDAGPNVNAADPENFTKPFTMSAFPQGDDSEVSFKVTGTYSVSFQ